MFSESGPSYTRSDLKWFQTAFKLPQSYVHIPKVTENHTKVYPKGNKMHPWMTRSHPHTPKVTTKSSQIDPKGSQGHPHMPRMLPKWSQGELRMPPEWSKFTPKWSQGEPKSRSYAKCTPKVTPKWRQSDPESPHIDPKPPSYAQNHPKVTPQMPKWPQSHPIVTQSHLFIFKMIPKSPPQSCRVTLLCPKVILKRQADPEFMHSQSILNTISSILETLFAFITNTLTAYISRSPTLASQVKASPIK